jgi:DNA-binding NarL/FixJ family response regulator
VDKPTDVSIISNSQLLSEGFTAILAAYPDLALMKSYPGTVPGGTPMRHSPRHVVLIDASIGQAGAVTWTRYWRSQIPPAHVVLLELNNDIETIMACVEAGASGYTLQGMTVQEIVETVRRVQQGFIQCSLEIISALLARRALLHPPDLTIDPAKTLLTPREFDVLTCLSEGCSNRQIAERLVIEVHTVKYHVHNILEKLKVAHRWDAGRLAVDQGWITRPTPAQQTRQGRRP